ncbi:TIGR03915 family putative DNA repair protein [Heliophilum fasciatum]|uniref:Putative DNA metabolism protein n=1 Tax=Heliophilum fasciatum TaxID=35700 RepID=A0A4R2RV25_9FIRM|nr:TIGR03915 family putative DNA repair protein [Heliophilum fasciatum]MCW2278346.1 putative DNA metabolism protein [Heliophilum fasciatum]TCP63781.1 putative DNA metabolism protein [Heliophilum fasciatum]
MLQYRYDGSFEGLLTAVFEAYRRREFPEQICSEEEASLGLFTEPVVITTDPAKAERVYRSIGERISPQALHHVTYAFLSELPGREDAVLGYLRLGWQVGSAVDACLTEDAVAEVHRLSAKVRHERHRLLGLIRFRLLPGDVYYAPVSPDHQVVALLAPHFAERLADQRWVIHDLKRGLAVMYTARKWIVTDIGGTPWGGADLSVQVVAEDEALFQQLWQGYFTNIAVEGRTNRKLQRRCMPKRYWPYLIEKVNS